MGYGLGGKPPSPTGRALTVIACGEDRRSHSAKPAFRKRRPSASMQARQKLAAQADSRSLLVRSQGRCRSIFSYPFAREACRYSCQQVARCCPSEFGKRQFFGCFSKAAGRNDDNGVILTKEKPLGTTLSPPEVQATNSLVLRLVSQDETLNRVRREFAGEDQRSILAPDANGTDGCAAGTIDVREHRNSTAALSQ